MSTEYHDRIVALADRARRESEAFEPPPEPPDEEKALLFLREGVGRAVGLYIEAHTAAGPARFTPAELSLLERAMNDWLGLYARCYDVSIDADFTVRECAQLLLDTHNIKETAQLLMRVPDRANEQPTTNG